MRNTFLLSAVLMLALVGVRAEAGWMKIPSETDNYCVDQSFGHLRYLFGKEIQLKKVFTDGCSSCNNYDWIKSNICSGYFVASFHGASSCKTTHYGRHAWDMPIYITRIWAYGDCKKLMPRDTYLTKENTFPYINNGLN